MSLAEFSKNIMIVGTSDSNKTKSITFRTACSCGSLEHDVMIDVEFDKEYSTVDMVFYKNVSVRSYTHKEYKFTNVIREALQFLKFKSSYIDTITWDIRHVEYFFDWIRDIKRRIVLAFKLIGTGVIEMDEGFVFKDEDHVRSFVKAIEEGLCFVKESE